MPEEFNEFPADWQPIKQDKFKVTHSCGEQAEALCDNDGYEDIWVTIQCRKCKVAERWG